MTIAVFADTFGNQIPIQQTAQTVTDKREKYRAFIMVTGNHTRTDEIYQQNANMCMVWMVLT